MCAAPCSWRVSTRSMSFCWHRTSKIFSTTPPGKPKTVLTPSRLNDSQNISAPDNFIPSTPLLNRAVLPMLSQNLHHAVFADEFQFLDLFHLQLSVRREVVFMLKLRELLLKLPMFFVEFFKLRILVQ